MSLVIVKGIGIEKNISTDEIINKTKTAGIILETRTLNKKV